MHSFREDNSRAYIQSKCSGAVDFLVTVNTNQALTVLKQAGLQADDNELHTGTGMLPNILLYFVDIGIIERGVNLIKNKERARLVAVDGEQQGQGCHSLFTSGQVLHIAESLKRWHGMVFYTRKVRHVGIFLYVKISLAAERVGFRTREVLVDMRNLLLNVREGFVKDVVSFLLDVVK